MKTASTLLQIAALGACLAMQFHAPGEFRMPGMRRALQTMTPQGGGYLRETIWVVQPAEKISGSV